MVDKWEIEWERNQNHDGEKRAVSIGPIQAGHDHWSGWTIADASDAYKAAAAPEMYEALKESLSYFKDLHSEDMFGACVKDVRDCGCHLSQHYNAVLDILAKAEGREV